MKGTAPLDTFKAITDYAVARVPNVQEAPYRAPCILCFVSKRILCVSSHVSPSALSVERAKVGPPNFYLRWPNKFLKVSLSFILPYSANLLPICKE